MPYFFISLLSLLLLLLGGIFINNFFTKFISILIFLIIFSCICYYFQISEINSNNENKFNYDVFFSESTDFFWPTPGFNKITSYFGNRKSPTTGASTYHSGIDISAYENSSIYSILDGTVSFTGFKGANGFTIIIDSSNIQIYYSHVSPNFLVYPGMFVSKSQKIGNVGPKYVYDVLNNPYKDSNGKPTNGATTGPHLHLTIKKDGKAVNPLNYF